MIKATITVKAAAARLDVTTAIIYYWSKNGCPWLGGRRLKITQERRSFAAKLRNVSSVSRDEGHIDIRPVEQIEKARRAAGVVGDGLISRPDALRRFSWLTKHMLRQWTLPLVTHHRYKRGGRRSDRGNCPALGRRLHVERYTTLVRGAKRESPYYRLAELEAIEGTILADLGRHVENGVEYKTTVRLRRDHQQKYLKPHQLAVWVPDRTYQPMKRVLLTKLKGRALARREQLLWPVAETQLALDRRDTARRAGWRGRGRWIADRVQSQLNALARNGSDDRQGPSAKKPGPGRPKGKTKFNPDADAKLLNDFRSSGFRRIADFARVRGLQQLSELRALKAALNRAKVRAHRVTKMVS